jgi:hypothetical protein
MTALHVDLAFNAANRAFMSRCPRSFRKRSLASLKAPATKLKTTKHKNKTGLLRATNRVGANGVVMACWERDGSQFQAQVDGCAWA